MAKQRGFSKKYLDSLWAKRVKENAGHVCEICGATEGLQAHHIHHRSNHSVRWWLRNGACLCNSCHLASNYSAHKNPAFFLDKMRGNRGEVWYNELVQRTAECFPWKKNLDRIKAYLKDETDDYLFFEEKRCDT